MEAQRTLGGGAAKEQVGFIRFSEIGALDGGERDDDPATVSTVIGHTEGHLP
jgi:hypothetical protein